MTRVPELPEVETTRRGVEPLIVGKGIIDVVVRNRSLRQPVTSGLPRILRGRSFKRVRRRAKYLLFETGDGTLLVHLGMSGSLRVVPSGTPVQKHDHLDIVFEDNVVLRYRDARRFGLVLWVEKDPLCHPLLSRLGPEPLAEEFNGGWLHRRASGRRLAVKPFLMDQATVVGVGNIYASEALFLAGIDPQRPAGEISRARYARLAETVRAVLEQAIHAGGTTLRDFSGADGSPGYFAQSLKVYGREGEPCTVCGSPILCRVIGQRSSYYCRRCQR